MEILEKVAISKTNLIMNLYIVKNKKKKKKQKKKKKKNSKGGFHVYMYQ